MRDGGTVSALDSGTPHIVVVLATFYRRVGAKLEQVNGDLVDVASRLSSRKSSSDLVLRQAFTTENGGMLAGGSRAEPADLCSDPI
jgi:hypothetical protein